MAKYQKNISHPLELWCAVARNVDGIMPDSSSSGNQKRF